MKGNIIPVLSDGQALEPVVDLISPDVKVPDQDLRDKENSAPLTTIPVPTEVIQKIIEALGEGMRDARDLAQSEKHKEMVVTLRRMMTVNENSVTDDKLGYMGAFTLCTGHRWSRPWLNAANRSHIVIHREPSGTVEVPTWHGDTANSHDLNLVDSVMAVTIADLPHFIVMPVTTPIGILSVNREARNKALKVLELVSHPLCSHHGKIYINPKRDTLWLRNDVWRWEPYQLNPNMLLSLTSVAIRHSDLRWRGRIDLSTASPDRYWIGNDIWMKLAQLPALETLVLIICLIGNPIHRNSALRLPPGDASKVVLSLGEQQLNPGQLERTVSWEEMGQLATEAFKAYVIQRDKERKHFRVTHSDMTAARMEAQLGRPDLYDLSSLINVTVQYRAIEWIES